MMIFDSKPLYSSRLYQQPEGRQVLVVYYHGNLDDWKEAIEWAKRHYNLSGPVQTITIPERA